MDPKGQAKKSQDVESPSVGHTRRKENLLRSPNVTELKTILVFVKIFSLNRIGH